MTEKLKGAGKQWERYKYALAAAVLGIVLLALPAGRGKNTTQSVHYLIELYHISSQKPSGKPCSAFFLHTFTKHRVCFPTS